MRSVSPRSAAVPLRGGPRSTTSRTSANASQIGRFPAPAPAANQ